MHILYTWKHKRGPFSSVSAFDMLSFYSFQINIRLLRSSQLVFTFCTASHLFWKQSYILCLYLQQPKGPYTVHSTNHTQYIKNHRCAKHPQKCIIYVPYQTSYELSYAVAVSYFSRNSTRCRRLASCQKLNTCRSHEWLETTSYETTAECGSAGEPSWHCSCCCPEILLGYCFPSSLFHISSPPEGNLVRCLRSPVGHREKSKVSPLCRASKKTRDCNKVSQHVPESPQIEAEQLPIISHKNGKTFLLLEYEKAQWVCD